jgi:hypothetical protein
MTIIKKYLPALFLVVLAGVGCKKYVDVTNPDTLYDPTYWKNENSVRTYAWEFYNTFTGFGNGTATNGDFYFHTLTDDQAASAFTQFPQTTASSNGEWSFSTIRKANIMLERIDGVDMSADAKNHWKGIARFFRANQYFRLVQIFGGVPFFGNSLELSDTAKIYKPRDARKMVMDSVLADLNFAVANIRQKDQDNTINRDVALALKARICLFEGTYRKYHTELSLPDADKYLLEAKSAAQTLMSTSYVLSPNYQSTYNSDNLSGNKEILLYKRYEAGLLMHSVIAYNYSSTAMHGLSKAAVESYVADDGLPIGLSPRYQGDNSITTIVANRDRRLKLTIDTTDLYYIGKVNKNGLTSSTGYRPTKYLPDTNKLKTIPTAINTAVTDAPLFWLAEIYLIYAEAAAELDQMGKHGFTQADLDNSINKLRARAGVAKLEYKGGQNVGVNGTQFVDPKKDADVTSLIWEIRRERRVELMMDGFRFQDLMRWKKGKYLDSNANPDSYLGAKVPANASVRRNALGYIMPYTAAQQRTFGDPKNYLSAIPTSQILLYPQTVQTGMQNPGW